VEYIKYVESNIKGGVSRELAQRTVLFGPNGSGKSSVVQAIQLAADGSIRDGEGREKIKEFGAVARFFPTGEKVLFSTLTLSNDNVRHWEIKSSGKKWKGGKEVKEFEVAFPFEEVKSVLAKGDKEIRAWLSGHILGESTLEVITSVLTDEQADLIRRLAAESGCDVDWNVLATTARKAATSRRRTATTKEKTVGQLTEGVSTPLSAGEKEELSARAEALRAEMHAEPERGPVDKAVLDRSLAGLKRDLSGVEAVLMALDEAEAAPPPEPVPVEEGTLTQAEVDTLNKLRALLVFHVENFGAENCMVCRTQGIEDQLLEQVALVEEGSQLPRAAPRLEAVDASAARAGATTKRDALCEAIALKEAELAAFTPVSHAGRREELKAISNKLAIDISAKRAWDNVRAVNAEVARLRSGADTLCAAAKMLEQVGKKRLSEGLASFEAEVNCFLTPGEVIGVDLNAGRIGFKRGDSLYTALSGGEWSALLLALGSYVAGKQSADTVVFLSPDDRGLDGSMLSRIMEGLSDFDGQVVIMSTTCPDAVPEGGFWDVQAL
jgi:energy-coupling factor transporter ATP-binding protein EcfA2